MLVEIRYDPYIACRRYATTELRTYGTLNRDAVFLPISNP